MKDAVNIRAPHHASSHGSTIFKGILALDNKISDAVRMTYTSDIKKRELLKNPTKIEEIQERKKIIDRN